MLAALLLAGLLLSQYADWYTTDLGLKLGATEANPIVATIITNYGMRGLLFFKLAFGIIAWVTTRDRKWAAVLLITAFFGVSLWNMHRIAELLPL